MSIVLMFSLQLLIATDMTGWNYYIKNDIPKSIQYFEQKANLGDKDACFVTGMMYLNIPSLNKSKEEAIIYLKKASDLGSADATYNLFVLAYEDKKDSNELKNIIEKAAEQGSVDAHVFLSVCYSDKKSILGNTEEDFEKSYKHIKAAHAIAPNPYTYFALGSTYVYGELMQIKTETNIPLGIKYLEKSLKDGFIAAAIPLKNIYAEGNKVPKDEKKSAYYENIMNQNFDNFFTTAVEIRTPKMVSKYSILNEQDMNTLLEELKKRANNGDISANKELFIIYTYGTHHIPVNKEVAREYLENAAKAKDIEAMLTLYETAPFFEREQYIPYLEEAAKNNNTEALIALGEFYRTSNNDTINNADGLQFYIKAAELGSIDAMMKLAEMYKIGEYYFRLNQNDKEAIKWYKKAIEHDEKQIDAYFGLLTIYNTSSSISDEEAFVYTTKLLEYDKNNQYALLTLGNLYSLPNKSFSDKSKAIEILSDAITWEDISTNIKANAILNLAKLYSNDESKTEDYAKAIDLYKLLLEIDKSTNDFFKLDPIVYYQLGKVYDKGLGGEQQNKELAKKYYSEALYYYSKEDYYLDTKNLLADLLVQSTDKEEVQEGIKYYLELIQAEDISEEKKTKLENSLLEHLDSNLVQDYIYLKHKQADSFDNPYKKIIEQETKKGNKDFFFYNVLINKSSDKEELLQEIEILANKDDIRAISYIIDQTKDWKEELEWENKKATLTSTDKDIYRVISLADSQHLYDEVVSWYDKLSDDDYMFAKSKVKEARKKIAEKEALETKAKTGDPQALLDLGESYESAKYGVFDEDKAFEYYKKAADAGNIEAIVKMADFYYSKGSEAEQKQAIKYYFDAANAGNKKAMLKIAENYLSGDKIEENREEAKNWFEKVYNTDKDYNAELYLYQIDKINNYLSDLEGNNNEKRSAAKYYLADAYENGVFIKRDTIKSEQYLNDLVAEENQKAIIKLGEIYAIGKERVQNWEKAIQYLDKLDKKENNFFYKTYQTMVKPYNEGNLEAKYNLGYTYINAYQFRESPKVKALGYELINEAANKNYPKAQFEMSKLCNDKSSPFYNEKESMKWLQKAVDNNNASAIIELAKKIERQPLDKNIKTEEERTKKIESLLLKAVKNDSSESVRLANFYLKNKQTEKALKALNTIDKKEFEFINKSFAEIYSNPEYKKQDFKKAKSYYENLYNKGYYSYGFNIAELLVNGDRTLSRNQEKAMEWNENARIALLNDSIDTETNNYFSYLLLYDDVARISLNIADNLYEGNNGYTKDVETAIKWYEEVTKLTYDQKVKSALNMLKEYYTERNEYPKTYYYSLALEDWDSNDLATSLSSEQKTEIKKQADNYKEFLMYLPKIDDKKRIEQNALKFGGNYEIAYAKMFIEGEYTPKDIKRGISILEKSASKGNLYAYNVLGNIYKQGNDDISIDINKALYYLKLGADAGDSNCAHQVGDIYYFQMEGAPADYEQAVRYFDMTDIKQGKHHAQAKYKLAYIYYKGLGNVKQDLSKAKSLLEFASENGEEKATEALNTWNLTN